MYPLHGPEMTLDGETFCSLDNLGRGPPMARFRFFSKIRDSLWFVPVLCVIAGALLSFGTIAVDRAADYELVPQYLTGDSDSALAILTTVATSMVTLTALVLTVTMVVVQLAMGQFSPRIVQTFLRDKPSQLAIGIFVATFVHAMLAMREVQSGEQSQVPGLAIIVAYALIVISIVVLVLYVHHIGQSLRVSALIELVGTDTRRVLDECYPSTSDGAPESDDIIAAPHSGVVSHVDHEGLVRLASQAHCRLDLLAPMGSFVPAGAPLLRIAEGSDELDRPKVVRAIALDLERSLEQDPSYGFRLLVDMAERSLAESAFLDPTTAVQAIDRLHDCLRQLARRTFPPGQFFDDEGELRLTQPVMEWNDYVHLAFDEIRLAGAGSPQIHRRLREALDDLRSVAPHDRRAPLDEQAELLARASKKAFAEPTDSKIAAAPDRQGIGVAG
jgi:uncharacterized membrane protein